MSSDISKIPQIDTEISKNQRKTDQRRNILTDTEETDIKERTIRLDSDRYQLVSYRKIDRKEQPY